MIQCIVKMVCSPACDAYLFRVSRIVHDITSFHSLSSCFDRKHSSLGLGAFAFLFGVTVVLSIEKIRELIASGDMFAFYNDRYWRKLSKKIIREHHKECLMCKAEHRLTRATLVHHVMHLREHPELAYSRTYTDADGKGHIQLMPLCHDCHERIHNRGIYAKRSGYTNEEKW